MKDVVTCFHVTMWNNNAISHACKSEVSRIVPCDLRRASLPVAAAISILFLDTLCSKKWYDIPHIRCDINSLQLSTIFRIGRRSSGYN